MARAWLSAPDARCPGAKSGCRRPVDRIGADREAVTVARDGMTRRSLPGREASTRSLTTLPVHSRMARGDLDRVDEFVASTG